MKTKKEIVTDWLPRYTDTPLKDFGKYILLVNFEEYLNMFSQWFGVPIRGQNKPMPNVTAENITLINFGTEDPEIAVTVLVEHGLHGGSGAAPVAKAVMQKYFADRVAVEVIRKAIIQ